jgi:hypothetical protein
MQVGSDVTERFELTFNITREDWIAANEALSLISPHWNTVAKQQRRIELRNLLWTSPLIVLGGAFLIGRGNSTRGMYVEGMLAGLLLCGLIAFGVSQMDYVSKLKKQSLERIRRADLSDHVGAVSVRGDESGVVIVAPKRELRLSWAMVVAHDIGEYVLLSHGGADGTFIPKAAFGSPAEAAEFVPLAMGWWRAAQMPPAERLARYLIDRDVACVGCGYNLRGVRDVRCPECGRALAMEELMSAKQ